MSIQEDLNNITINEKSNGEDNGEVNENLNHNKESKSKNKTVRTKRSDPTKGELIALAKKRAIDNFEKGIADPEYRVTKMINGKYRCYKRKVDLPPEPIKQDQIPKNIKSSDIVSDKISEPSSEPTTNKIKDKSKKKDKNDPFADIVYFNLNNQMNEQLNKRLDFLNHEIEKLHTKNTKLKGKYKQLKQAIYITESDDEENEKTTQEVEVHENTQTPTSTEPVTQPVTQPVIHRKTNCINFNQYFK